MEMIKSSYGNYVIQKALRVAKGEEREKFVNLIKKNLQRMNDKKVIRKWKNIINDITTADYSGKTSDDCETFLIPSTNISPSMESVHKYNDEFVNKNQCYFNGYLNSSQKFYASKNWRIRVGVTW